eukprot:TRINITY_DN77452_c0_g1_i1.p2 TRINITY_DN77452_c0_g1~~TRINITY_DN77452_c0_g1_i1.p2  ORF type:complete len:123 (-),score=17.06 TRINITY_DN77452_c0_g1_i1:132-500(-)
MGQVPGALQEQFEDHERVRDYWTALKETDESHAVTDYGKSWSFRFMFTHGVPFKILALRTGILRVPDLPEHIEKQIQAAYDERQYAYYGKAMPPADGEFESSESEEESDEDGEAQSKKKPCW